MKAVGVSHLTQVRSMVTYCMSLSAYGLYYAVDYQCLHYTVSALCPAKSGETHQMPNCIEISAVVTCYVVLFYLIAVGK